ncbi:MAG: DUF4301 family protein [Chitinophagaceae bacterium]|nr:DUF4301 family protein [Chitinophagaceae bacterium]
MFTEKERQQIEAKGIHIQEVENHIQRFQNRFPFPLIKSPVICLKITPEQEEYHLKKFYSLVKKKTLLKFVPASGSATRMLKDLYEFKNIYYKKTKEEVAQIFHPVQKSPIKDFFNNFHLFPFYKDIEEILKKKNVSLSQLFEKYDFIPIIDCLLQDIGYENYPKALIPFHSYRNKNGSILYTTPIEEHLIEAVDYMKTPHNKIIKVHFTVSAEHKDTIQAFVKQKQSFYEKKLDVQYEVSFSEQMPSTDTIAVDENNTPLRDENGNLIFRPSGHGALLHNLQNVDADIVFIKNIDNIVKEELKYETYRYQKIITTMLLELQSQVFKYIKALQNTSIPKENITNIFSFLENVIHVEVPATITLEPLKQQKKYILSKLNRPIRICGMVKNEGEPGGAPFLCYEKENNSSSIQIIEKAQIDENDTSQVSIFNQSTHFNPVFMVCALKDWKHKKFSLTLFRDENAGIITQKSLKGKISKTLELPGLWNGSMSNWTTICIEIPSITFAPVKKITDLLHKYHQ